MREWKERDGKQVALLPNAGDLRVWMEREAENVALRLVRERTNMVIEESWYREWLGDGICQVGGASCQLVLSTSDGRGSIRPSPDLGPVRRPLG